MARSNRQLTQFAVDKIRQYMVYGPEEFVDEKAGNTEVAVVDTEVVMETDLDGNTSISFTLGANHVLSDQMVRDLVLYSRIKYACTKKPFESGVKKSYVCFQRYDTSKLFELGKVCLKNVKYSRFWGLKNHIKISHVDLEIIDDGPDRFVVKYRFKTLALTRTPNDVPDPISERHEIG